MKKVLSLNVLCFFLLLLSFNAFGESDKVSGVIHFTDGTTLEFSNIIQFNAFYKGNPTANRSIPVKINDKIQIIPFSELKSFKILEMKNVNVNREGGPPTKILTGTAEIKTISGKQVNCEYDSIGRLEVEVLDKATNKVTQQMLFAFDFQNKTLWIKEIVFNN